ncbi:membrane protein [Sphingomonas insulae]|uniref:YihY family inner membrane protein n=1 Tax=Sphingomonas insulae TaxID=424800 RepID=A0ABN1HNJ2_9SPHN|nr:YhjD/YihY/BrkB family envelope integrity protein [Sphingomonas insulae]NIJ30878.1 membrane protein [Sphingomonas insulae]
MDDRGHQAASPWALSRGGWKAVLTRTWAETSSDNVGLIAAGVAFYGFLALVPLLGAFVLSYGLIADRATVIADVNRLASVMPADAARLVGEQLLNVVQSSDGKKGLGLLLALALALFGARNAAGAVITALNVAYEEEEKRGFVKVNLLALGITAAAVVVALVAAVAITALGKLQDLLPGAPGFVVAAGKLGSYALLLVAGAGAAATLYRYGPSRAQARWMWLTPGSLFAALGWLILSLGFGLYVASFGNYNATYGSLGAVVVMLTWMYLSSYILVFGAELNAELEHQTAHDTTTGMARPLGSRGSWVADHVAGDKVDRVAPAESHRRQHGMVSEFAVSRVTARAAQVAGLGKAGLATSATATIALRLLRKPGQARVGMALLGASALAAWLTRERMQIRAVLFDLDGTLVDSNGFHIDAWERVFREGGHVVSRERIAGQIGKGGDLLVPALLPDVPQAERNRLATRHGEVFKARYLDLVRPFPGATSLLRRVNASGRQVVLASSASGEELDHYVRLLGVEGLVTAKTSKEDVSTTKPAGDIFAAALAKAGVSSRHAVVIGDTPYDIAAAAKCGFPAVAVRSGGFDDDDLRDAVALYDDVEAVLAGFDRSPLAR